MNEIRALIKRFTGTSNPLFSLTFWGLALWSGIPTAVLQTFGIDISGWAEKAGGALAVFGVRRRLPGK